METGTTTTTTVDLTPLLDKMEYQNNILIVETGFIFALLVSMMFHLVLNRGFK